MPPYGEYSGYAAPTGGYPQYPPPPPPQAAAGGYAYAAPQYAMPPQPAPMSAMPVMSAAPPPPPAPVAYAPAAPAAPSAIPVVYQQQKKSKTGGLFGGLRHKAGKHAYIPTPAPAPTGGAGGLLSATGNAGMESIYASTPDQIRRAADYNEKESQHLLNSLMSSNMGKKEMQHITSKAYAHANEAKRLLRKAELLDAELLLQKEEREHDEMDRRRRRHGGDPYDGCGVAPGVGARGDVEMRQPQDDGDCNMALCGAFGGGGGDVGDQDSILLQGDDVHRGVGDHHSHYGANSIIHQRPMSIEVRTSPPSYDIKEHEVSTSTGRDAADKSTRGQSKSRLGVMGFLRGRSKFRDASARNIGIGEQTRDEGADDADINFSQDVTTLRNPDIVHSIHKVEAEVKNILDHENSNGGNDDDADSAGYAVAPSSLRVISKVDAVRPPKAQHRKLRPGDVILDLSAMLIDEERDRAAGRKSGDMSLGKPVHMTKRSTSFRKAISRLTGNVGKSKTAQGFIGSDDSDDEDMGRIDGLESRDPALIAKGRTDDISLPAVSKPSALDIQRSRKDQAHDELDADAIKVSESFNGFVGQRRSDLLEQRKQYELSQMQAFYEAYGEEAYREVYGPYEEQLGYGLFYNGQAPLDRDDAEQDNGYTQHGPTMARGRSAVRSAARKMKRSLSRTRDKNQNRNELQNSPPYQAPGNYLETKSMYSRSMAQEEQWKEQPKAIVEPVESSPAAAPCYTETHSPMNLQQQRYSDHNKTQQQQRQWVDGIGGTNEYGVSPPVPTPTEYHPISVTESQLARQRSSNRNNKQSVDKMLRRMRSESTDEIESRM